jgi:L-lactate dehydrogenase complex protein LldG
MEESTSREKVLKRIRKALLTKSTEQAINVDFESSVYANNAESLEINFAQNFTEAGGKFVFCLDYSECIDNLTYLSKENNWSNIFCLEEPLKELLSIGEIVYTSENSSNLPIHACITTCEFLVAQTGSVVISSNQSSGRKTAFAFSVHLVVAFTSQLVAETKEAIKNIRLKYSNQIPSQISFISGPSRTNALEENPAISTLGPKEIIVFLIDDLEVE